MDLKVSSRFRILKVVPETEPDQTGKGQALCFLIDEDIEHRAYPRYVSSTNGEVYWSPPEYFSEPESDEQVNAMYHMSCQEFKDLVYAELYPHDEEPPEMQYE